MYVRLAFAVAVHVDPDLLLVDEVLAVGDEPFQRKCMDRIHGFQSEGRTIVIVSHALDQIAELCDRAVVLEHGNVRVDGDPIEALRYLRADFEVTRQEERERTRAVELVKSTPPARVHSVDLVDDEGRPLRKIRPGDPMTVIVNIDAQSLPRGWVLAIGISTSLGVGVFNTHNRLLGLTMPSLVGRGEYKIRLAHVWLSEGSFGVRASVSDEAMIEMDKIAEGTTFTVESDGRTTGVLYVDPQMVLP